MCLSLTSYWSVQMCARWPPLLQADIESPESIASPIAMGGGAHRSGGPQDRCKLDGSREAEVWWGRWAQLRSLFKSPYSTVQHSDGETAS